MESLNLIQLVVGVGIACLIAAFSYAMRALTGGGAVTLIIIGAVIFGLGGWAFGIPIVFFFVSSSILSHLKSAGKQQAMTAFDKIGARDTRQVLANGGVGTISTLLFVFTGWPGWYLVYLAAIGEACADTWATEIGTLTKQQPRLILNMKIVEAGRSGGITIFGTSAALVGSFLTVFGGFLVTMTGTSREMDVASLLLCTGMGFLGAIVDSILGASVQAQYTNQSTGKLTEKSTSNGQPNTHVGGLKFFDNDLVNFLSTVSAAMLTAVLARLLL